MSRDVVEKILAASRSIDRMREETDQTVRIVLGLAQKTQNWRAIAKTNFGTYFDGGAHWRIADIQSNLHAQYVRGIVHDPHFIVNDEKAAIVDYSSATNWINGVKSA